MNSLRDRGISLICRFLSHLSPHQPLGDFPLQTVDSVLILKPCCLGDVLMSTPTIAALRIALPQARIDFAVGPWARPMVEHNPNLNEIVDCGPVGSGRYRLRDFLTLVRRIKGQEYDVCFVLDRSPLISLLPFLAGIRHRVGLDSQGRGFSLTVRVPVEGAKHEAELYLDTVRAVGIEPFDPKLEFHPSLEDRTIVDRLMREAGYQELDAKRSISSVWPPIVVIHPAGGKNPGMELTAKRWPPQRFAAVGDRLMEEKKAQVILVGGPSDVAIAQSVLDSMKHQPWDLTGRLTLGQLGVLLQRCHLFIGNDTGAMHLAGAVGTPTVAIFGPSDPGMYGPYGQTGIPLWHDVGCNPCFVAGHARSDCHPALCIEAVSIDEVYQATERLLNKTRGS
ncbi:MAG: lipopolysaccharide heptosyltransferase II [Anaerolineae bacterium]